MQDSRAESHALLPSARQAAGDLLAFLLQAREIQYPAFLFVELGSWHRVNPGKELQVLFNGQVVVQRELLRHVSYALAHPGRTQISTAFRESDVARARLEKTAQHLDRGGLAGAVRP